MYNYFSTDATYRKQNLTKKCTNLLKKTKTHALLKQKRIIRHQKKSLNINRTAQNAHKNTL